MNHGSGSTCCKFSAPQLSAHPLGGIYRFEPQILQSQSKGDVQMDPLTWFIIWVVLSVLVGMWNQNPGNSFWMGLILAVLLSPIIGGIVVAVTKPNKEAMEKRELASGKMKKCPACAELIRADATKCRHCGSTVQSIAKA